MDKLCRFCLKVSNKNVCNLQGCDILYNIRRFLTIDISTEDSFPNKLCKDCFKNITQLIEFCLKIKENEENLHQYLNNDTLQDYYSKLTNNAEIKDEENENMIFTENSVVKIEDSTYKEQVINENHDKIYFQSSESAYNSDAIHYSSEDEITLSSIKKEKETNTTTVKKNKQQKSLKRKSSNDSQDIKVTQYTNTKNLKQFTCLTCLKECESHTDLTRHYYEEHFQDKDNVKYTETVLDGKVVYSCNCCKICCDLKKDIVKHVVQQHNERPLICKLCARTYKTVPDIVRHARVHTGFRLHCSYKCGYNTAYRGHLKEHEKKHKDGHKYTCEKCGKGFPVRTWYEQHQNIHKGVKPFVCDICGLAFHMARYLSTHRSSIHSQSSKVKRYICIHCNEKFDSANNLGIHLLEHDIIRNNEYLCDFCGKVLRTSYQLKYHHRMHLGVKPFSCTICNKTFSKKFNVQLHMAIHSGEKIHSCVLCGKRYSQRSTLLRHCKTHHGITGKSPKRDD